MLLVDAMDWDLAYKDLTKKIACNPESNKYMMHRCEFCFDTATMEEFINHELNKRKDDEEFNYCQWDTTDRATLAVITVT